MADATFVYRVTPLSPVEEPDRGWCPACRLPSLFVWHLAVTLNDEPNGTLTYGICADCGARLS